MEYTKKDIDMALELAELIARMPPQCCMQRTQFGWSLWINSTKHDTFTFRSGYAPNDAIRAMLKYIAEHGVHLAEIKDVVPKDEYVATGNNLEKRLEAATATINEQQRQLALERRLGAIGRIAMQLVDQIKRQELWEQMIEGGKGEGA